MKLSRFRMLSALAALLVAVPAMAGPVAVPANTVTLVLSAGSGATLLNNQATNIVRCWAQTSAPDPASLTGFTIRAVDNFNVDGTTNIWCLSTSATTISSQAFVGGGSGGGGGLTNSELRAAAVPVSGTFTSTGLTDAQLRASAVNVAGSVTTGGITDTQLRASAVPVSGPLTDTQLRAAAIPVSGTVSTGGITDAQLRASAVNVAGSVTTGGITDAQLRASAVSVSGSFFQAIQPVSLTSLPALATGGNVIGAVTQSGAWNVGVSGPVAVTGAITDAQIRASALPVSGAFFQATQPISASALPLPAGAATAAKQDTIITALGAPFQSGASLGAGTNSIGSVTSADVTSAGSLAAAAQTVALNITGGMSSASAQIMGTWVGTITFEGTVDGTNWTAINGTYAGQSTPGSTTTTNGVVRLTPGGLTSIRLNMTAFTSGSATITLRAGMGTGGTFLNQSLPVGTNTLGGVNLTQYTPITGRLPVDGSGVTQPVSGSFFQATQPISAAALPLPTGAATNTTLATLALETTQQSTLSAMKPGVYYNQSAGVTLAASATLTGTARDVGVAVSTAHSVAYFNASFIGDAAATVSIEGSNDNTTFYQLASSASVANTSIILSVPILTRYYRTKVVNGATAQTLLWVNNSFTGG